MKLSIIIPAYNEESTIEELISQVKKADTKDVIKEIIVVDDGSKDSTREILTRISDIKVIFHKKNGGKGRAIRTGIKHATGDIIIIQDADLEYDPNDYYKLIKPIIDKKTKVVYGSRYLSKVQKERNLDYLKRGGAHKYYLAYLGGRLLTTLANLLYNAHITDEPTCYKVFDAKVLKSITLRSRRFEFCPEVTAKVRKKGYKILELPTSYRPRSFEEGKKIGWKDGVHAVWILIKYRFVD